MVLAGILLGQLFDLGHEHKYLFLPHHEYVIGPKFLVSLPSRFWDGFTFPDFRGAWAQKGFLGVVVMLTLVQGVETLLSAAAVDRFDPQRRKTNLNRDLFAVGTGSALSGLLGGLPIIAEIVRSRANVSVGAQNRWSNFFHGLFMLAFVAFAPNLIHQIPLASLAAILIVTGYRLASPSQFKHTLEIGKEQLAVFCTTWVATLATDLVSGVAIGIALKIVIHLLRGEHPLHLIRAEVEDHRKGENWTLRVHSGAVFTNFLGIRKRLDRIPPAKRVKIDVSSSPFIDHTVMEKLQHFVEHYGRSGGRAQIIGLDRLRPASRHPLASRSRRRTFSGRRRPRARAA